MSRPMKRPLGKIEALDFAAGTYNTRLLKRERYSQHDFLEYLNALETMEFGPAFEEDSFQ